MTIQSSCSKLSIVRKVRTIDMREWLSGGVSPCQGEGRGFESRLALFGFKPEDKLHSIMREWLSGGVSPCQGEGRGFESRLALFGF